MNSSLTFPDFPPTAAPVPKGSLEGLVRQFETAHREDDSPIRAIHHQPAAEGAWAEFVFHPRAFHDHPDDLRSRLDFSFRDFEQQLVVDLQQHAGVQVFAGKGSRDAGHRALDDVGGRALQRRIDRLPLSAGPAAFP